MKITKIQTTHVEVPADEPLANGPQEKGAVRKLIATKISTDQGDRKSTRLNSSHVSESRMPSSA